MLTRKVRKKSTRELLQDMETWNEISSTTLHEIEALKSKAPMEWIERDVAQLTEFSIAVTIKQVQNIMFSRILQIVGLQIIAIVLLGIVIYKM